MRKQALRRLVTLTVLIVLGAAAGTLRAQQQLPLSSTATASVITCGPGNEFYLAFGHSAIRITDTARGIDLAYNYGTFDFDTPHFYWKFARGMLNYCLSRSRFDHFMNTYGYERRAVWEQRLDLTPQEVSNLYLMLEWNYQPGNRYYQYDFFRDNCATRVRDMVESTCGKQEVEYGDWKPESYRCYVHRSAGSTQQWWVLGVDLLLGLPADHRCSGRDAMFHPMLMMQQYATAVRGSQPLMADSHQWLSDHREPLHRSFPPLVVFSLLFVAVSLLSWKHLWPRWADRILFVLAGIVGLVLCFMWFGTDHWCTKWNLNILWSSPLLILIAIRHKKSPLWGLWLQEGCFALAAASA